MNYGYFSGSILPLILYESPFQYTLNGSGNSTITNQRSGSVSDLLMATGRHLNLDATQYIDMPIYNSSLGGSFLTYFNITLNARVTLDMSVVAPGVTTYRLQGITGGLKINSILKHKSIWDTHDATAIDANPNLVGALALSPTRSIPELNKVLDVTDEYFMCSELSGTTITGAKNATAATIANYTTAARIKGATKGLQLSAFPSDALGVPLSYTTDRLVYKPNQTITIPLTTPIVHTMTKDIAKIEGS